jgi:hypothetical protein
LKKKILEKLWIHNGSEKIHKSFYTFDFFLSFSNKLIKNNHLAHFKTFSAAALPQKCGSCNSNHIVWGLEFQNMALMKLKLWGVTS